MKRMMQVALIPYSTYPCEMVLVSPFGASLREFEFHFYSLIHSKRIFEEETSPAGQSSQTQFDLPKSNTLACEPNADIFGHVFPTFRPTL